MRTAQVREVTRHPLVPGHRDLELRQRVLDEYGIDTQVLTFTTPGVHVEMPELAIELARQINDEFAAIVRTRKKRFAALVTLPLNDPEESARELDRAMTELRLPGAMVFSNINRMPLADDAFEPLWTKPTSSARSSTYIPPIRLASSRCWSTG